MADRSDATPRRISVNTYTGSTPTPVSPPTPQCSPAAAAPVAALRCPNECAPQSGVVYNGPAMPAFPQGPFSYTPGLWVHGGMPFAAPVSHPGSCRTCSPPPTSAELGTPKERRSADVSSHGRKKSLRRTDTPYMLQRCGPFFAWQLVIMWMAILGTVVFVCTFGAFRHYLLVGSSLEGSNKAKESALKNERSRRIHRPPVYVNATCGIQNPCRGVGLLCIGNHCHCGPDFEEQGELCSPKKNARREGGVDGHLSTLVPDRHQREDSGRDVPDPRQGVHKVPTLNEDVVRRHHKAMGEASTFVFATFEYEDHVHRHTATRAPTSATEDMTSIPTHNQASKHRRKRRRTEQSDPAT